jgi:hypothetical protein
MKPLVVKRAMPLRRRRRTNRRAAWSTAREPVDARGGDEPDVDGRPHGGNPRTLHFTPTYSSWLKLVERRFAEVTKMDQTRDPSLSQSPQSRRSALGSPNWNDHPAPYVWHETADETLDSPAGNRRRPVRECPRICASVSERDVQPSAREKYSSGRAMVSNRPGVGEPPGEPAPPAWDAWARAWMTCERRLPDEVVDELSAGARTEEEIVGRGGVLSQLTKRPFEERSRSS